MFINMGKENGKEMNNPIDLMKARKFLTDLVPQAGETLRKYFASGDFTQRSKGGVDFVTQVDEEIDAFLMESIKKQFPQTNFLTEETAPKDYLSLKDVDNLWVIDPLDGTTNFCRGFPHFAISVALVNQGDSKLGVVYVPMTNDCYWAQEDEEGAFLNGESIKVSDTKDLKTASFGIDWPWELEKRKTVVELLGKISPNVRAIKSNGSLVADLAGLANGVIDVYLHPGLKPWDVAASALLIEKAGGKVTTLSGDAWNVFNSDILASNGILHEKVVNLLNTKKGS